ncbi:hypothetical protein BT67DRAFT_189588 [Trichocladium antarcticum]|uniref:Uncharacterized protein n=1 Tax=Trichocladium antarcticum TaxID=1450529 RepID=A0AAN6UPB8_9PEZI|nr:hypothetical protein BT67DRAFT_189588 [Trichocladium antarcticum]
MSLAAGMPGSPGCPGMWGVPERWRRPAFQVGKWVLSRNCRRCRRFSSASRGTETTQSLEKRLVICARISSTSPLPMQDNHLGTVLQRKPRPPGRDCDRPTRHRRFQTFVEPRDLHAAASSVPACRCMTVGGAGLGGRCARMSPTMLRYNVVLHNNCSPPDHGSMASRRKDESRIPHVPCRFAKQAVDGALVTIKLRVPTGPAPTTVYQRREGAAKGPIRLRRENTLRIASCWELGILQSPIKPGYNSLQSIPQAQCLPASRHGPGVVPAAQISKGTYACRM